MTEEKKEPTLSELIQRIGEKIDSPDSLIVYMNVSGQVFKMYPVEENIHDLPAGEILVRCMQGGVEKHAVEFMRNPQTEAAVALGEKLKRLARAMYYGVSKSDDKLVT